MAAELDLDGRRKPTQQVTLALGHEKRRLGEVVFGGDRLHHLVRQPFGERAHGSRIATEQAARERVNLEERYAHESLDKLLPRERRSVLPKMLGTFPLNIGPVQPDVTQHAVVELLKQ